MLSTTSSHIDIASLKHSKALAALDLDLQSFIRQQIALQNDEHGLTRAAVSQQSDDISKKLELIKLSQAENAAYQQLLSSLRFPGMNGRRNQIAVAHLKTFRWIFGEYKVNYEADTNDSDDDDDDGDDDDDDDDDGDGDGNGDDDDDDDDDDSAIAAAANNTPRERDTANIIVDQVSDKADFYDAISVPNSGVDRKCTNSKSLPQEGYRVKGGFAESELPDSFMTNNATVEREQCMSSYDGKTGGDEASDCADNDPFLEQTYNCDNFVEWLTERDDNYWITGKPGSGKSTLMSFIINHELTLDKLKQWAAQQDIQVIDAYFWNAGSALQKSFKGMLATVILQLLEKADDELRERFINISGIKKKVAIDDWSTGELERHIHAFLMTSTSKFCMFFDGLDEVEITQSESDDVVVSFIELVSRLANVKCCMSSRPMQMFELAFQNCARLRLEHLNYRDIDRFFQDRLRSSIDKISVPLTEDDFDVLRAEFNRKADGVFLWAHCALNSILQGLRHHDAVSQLHQRLEALPSELESLYEHMLSLNNKDSSLYRQEAAFFIRILLLLSDYDCPAAYCLRPNLLQFTLCFDKRFVPAATQNIEASSLAEACREMRTRILTRCAGLLEIKTTFGRDRKESYAMLPLPRMLASERSRQVRLVHRTVKDFLLSSPAGQRTWADAAEYDAHLNEAFFQAMLKEQSLSTKPVMKEWLRILFRDIHDRRQSWTDEALSDIVRAAEETVESSTIRHLGPEKQNWFTRLSSWWADNKQNNIRMLAPLDILGYIMQNCEFALVHTIVAQQINRLTPDYCMYLLSFPDFTFHCDEKIHLELCALLTDHLAGKQRLCLLRTCGHSAKSEACKALWYSIPHIICERLLQVEFITGYTEMSKALVRVTDCNTPSLVAIAINLDTSFCSYKWLPMSNEYNLERELLVIIKLNSLHFISCYAALRKSGSMDDSDLTAGLEPNNGSPASLFDVEGIDKSLLNAPHGEYSSGPFPSSAFRKTNKTDSQLIKTALLRGSPLPYLISLGEHSFVVQDTALKEISKLIEPVAQRSEEVDYLDYMREEGYMVDAEDTRIMREPPKMLFDENGDEQDDAGNVHYPKTSIVRRWTNSSWGVDEFHDAET